MLTASIPWELTMCQAQDSKCSICLTSFHSHIKLGGGRGNTQRVRAACPVWHLEEVVETGFELTRSGSRAWMSLSIAKISYTIPVSSLYFVYDWFNSRWYNSDYTDFSITYYVNNCLSLAPLLHSIFCSFPLMLFLWRYVVWKNCYL